MLSPYLTGCWRRPGVARCQGMTPIAPATCGLMGRQAVRRRYLLLPLALRHDGLHPGHLDIPLLIQIGVRLIRNNLGADVQFLAREHREDAGGARVRDPRLAD